jgi:succinate dehydrogenase / fumarate reductase, cytochrome b subunit
MRWFLDFYRSTLGKKALVAVTGIVLFAFVLIHMIGNLKLFGGRESLNAYADWLRTAWAPPLPKGGLLWIVRGVLVVALVAHVAAVYQLTRANWRAAPEKYHRQRFVATGWSARTMRTTGVLILLFLAFHLNNFTFGTVHPDYHAHDVYHNVVTGFRRWPVSVLYIVAQLALGMHLLHGLWSIFQTLGWNHPTFNSWRRHFAITLAVLVAAGYIVIPLAVLARLVPGSQ